MMSSKNMENQAGEESKESNPFSGTTSKDQLLVVLVVALILMIPLAVLVYICKQWCGNQLRRRRRRRIRPKQLPPSQNVNDLQEDPINASVQNSKEAVRGFTIVDLSSTAAIGKMNQRQENMAKEFLSGSLITRDYNDNNNNECIEYSENQKDSKDFDPTKPNVAAFELNNNNPVVFVVQPGKPQKLPAHDNDSIEESEFEDDDEIVSVSVLDETEESEHVKKIQPVEPKRESVKSDEPKRDSIKKVEPNPEAIKRISETEKPTEGRKLSGKAVGKIELKPDSEEEVEEVGMDREDPCGSQSMGALTVLEYAQDEGGWMRKKVDSIQFPANTVYPKRTDLKSLDCDNFFIKNIWHPMENIIRTIALSPTESKSDMIMKNPPVQPQDGRVFQSEDFNDEDRETIYQEMLRLTAPKSVGMITLLDFAQAEGSRWRYESGCGKTDKSKKKPDDDGQRKSSDSKKKSSLDESGKEMNETFRRTSQEKEKRSSSLGKDRKGSGQSGGKGKDSLTDDDEPGGRKGSGQSGGKSGARKASGESGGKDSLKGDEGGRKGSDQSGGETQGRKGSGKSEEMKQKRNCKDRNPTLDVTKRAAAEDGTDQNDDVNSEPEESELAEPESVNLTESIVTVGQKSDAETEFLSVTESQATTKDKGSDPIKPHLEAELSDEGPRKTQKHRDKSGPVALFESAENCQILQEEVTRSCGGAIVTVVTTVRLPTSNCGPANTDDDTEVSGRVMNPPRDDNANPNRKYCTDSVGPSTNKDPQQGTQTILSGHQPKVAQIGLNQILGMANNGTKTDTEECIPLPKPEECMLENSESYGIITLLDFMQAEAGPFERGPGPNVHQAIGYVGAQLQHIWESAQAAVHTLNNDSECNSDSTGPPPNDS